MRCIYAASLSGTAVSSILGLGRSVRPHQTASGNCAAGAVAGWVVPSFTGSRIADGRVEAGCVDANCEVAGWVVGPGPAPTVKHAAAKQKVFSKFTIARPVKIRLIKVFYMGLVRPNRARMITYLPQPAGLPGH